MQSFLKKAALYGVWCESKLNLSFFVWLIFHHGLSKDTKGQNCRHVWSVVCLHWSYTINEMMVISNGNLFPQKYFPQIPDHTFAPKHLSHKGLMRTHAESLNHISLLYKVMLLFQHNIPVFLHNMLSFQLYLSNMHFNLITPYFKLLPQHSAIKSLQHIIEWK